MAKKETKQQKVLNLEEAQKVIKEARTAELKEAEKEYNEFLDNWEKKYNVTTIIEGRFIGGKIQTKVLILDKKN